MEHSDDVCGLCGQIHLHLTNLQLQCVSSHLLRWFEKSVLNPAPVHFGSIYTLFLSYLISSRCMKCKLGRTVQPTFSQIAMIYVHAWKSGLCCDTMVTQSLLIAERKGGNLPPGERWCREVAGIQIEIGVWSGLADGKPRNSVAGVQMSPHLIRLFSSQKRAQRSHLRAN